mgnify:CR=1 FL=1
MSYCFNGSKYFVCYPNSNDVYSTYIKYGQDIVNKKETERRQIRKYLQQKLNLNLDNLDDLINYMKKIEIKEEEYDYYFVDIVDKNFRLSELYQLKVLNMDFMDIISQKRHLWSFRAHIETGNGWIDGYIGEINLLNKQFGYPQE